MDTRQKRLLALIAVCFGTLIGFLIVLISTKASPKIALFALISLPVVAVVLIRPRLGFCLVVFVVPLERLGRFTGDSSMYTISLMRVLGLLALGSYLLHVTVKKKKLHFDAAFFLYVAYFGFAILTVTYSTHFLGSVRACGAMAGNVLFFFLIVNMVRGWKLARLAVFIWLWATVFTCVYTVIGWHRGWSDTREGREGTSHFDVVWDDTSEWEDLERKVVRAMGPASHAAVYGINLVMTLPFFVFLFRTRVRRFWKVAAFFCLLLVFYNILLTNTRAVILLAIVVMAMCVARRLLVIRPAGWAAFAVLGALCMPLVPADVYERVLHFENYTTKHSGTLRIRFDFWKAGLKIGGEHWMWGVGVGNEKEIPRYLPRIGPEMTSAHNEYIQTFMETGIFGWLTFFSFVGLILWRSFKTGAALKPSVRKRGPDEETYWFMVACQICMISVLIFGLQVDVFHFPLKGWWLIAGLSTVLYDLNRRRIERPRAVFAEVEHPGSIGEAGVAAA